MWFLRAPAAVLGLAALSCLPTISAKPYPVHLEELRELHNASQVEKRQCSGTPCGYYGQLCCTGNQQCFTDSNGQAQCGVGGGDVQQQGGWVVITTTWVETGAVTRTSVYSTYVGVTGAAQPTGTCRSSQSPCGSLCCDSGFYCNANKDQCLYIGGSSGGIIVTATGSPTRTVPFETPIATGASGTPEQVQSGGGGLSGGAIAGIVIGVIAGVILLLLLCLFCCAKSLFDAVIALFGLGKRRKHTKETTYVESHHHSSHGGAGGWYGHGPARPSRPHKEGSKFGNLLGIGAGLGALALALGLKRRHDKHDDKSTTISSSYYSDYYTSSSSASSDDRRTRNTRHSRR